ncbi:alcohol dehydrogenase [Fusarium solani]|uniref:alcohol dehydrogenase n=1 Tax=Fusarium solani TaxID=169388 RepID=A0A9P9FZ22_FUSSL|nr:alcohol dehydrogenase [Fusarium solani]KAH7230335.1 alcohol dehydrogenase [Fusarium solani]
MCAQRVAVLTNQGEDFSFSLQQRPIPTLEGAQVLVRLSTSGLCGTDFALAEGKFGPTRDILGHEGIGRVAKLGPAVTQGEVQVGQLVGVGWVRDACGSCHMCLAPGGETRCTLNSHSGWQVDGTLAEFAVVPSRYLVTLPEDVPHRLLAPVMCAGVTVYRALKTSQAIAGDLVAISGAGGMLGTLGIQYGRAMGLRVIAIDGRDQEQPCMAAGAEAYIDFTESSDLASRMVEVTDGRKVSAVLVCAGSVAAYESATCLVAPFGTIVCVGILPPQQKVGFSPTDLIDSGYQIIGSLVGTRKDIQEAADFVKRGLVKPQVRLVALSDLGEVLEEVRRGGEARKVVVDLKP